MNKVFEAIVVGSGATGGVAALTFAEAGVKVLVIEAGPELDPDEAFGSEPINTLRRVQGILNGEKTKQSHHPGYWKNNPDRSTFNKINSDCLRESIMNSYTIQVYCIADELRRKGLSLEKYNEWAEWYNNKRLR